MDNATHEKRIQKIEAECVEIKKQILQLEFQNKKDIREFEKRSKNVAEEDARKWKEHEQWRKELEKDFKFLSAHAKHLSKLAGITFEEFGELDERLESASVSLSRKSKKSK